MGKANRIIYIITAFLIAYAGTFCMCAQQRNDKVLNRPYADLRRWHLGFSVGINTLDLQFTHNGFITESGETWFMEQPSFSPGFCVNGLFDLRLNNYFSLRLSPGMYFGNRVVKMRNTSGTEKEQQNIKSTMLVLPVDVKFASLRYHNVRPYLTAGAMAVYDVYLPYFKFCPEIKFCFGLSDMVQHKRPDLTDDPDRMKFTNSLTKATQQMVVMTFYFE